MSRSFHSNHGKMTLEAMNLISYRCNGSAKYLQKGVGVDHEDRAEVILEVSREFGRRVINQACCLKTDQPCGYIQI